MINGSRVLLVVMSIACVSGCGTLKNTAVFVTKSTFGLDADSNPPGVSIGYDRVEGFYGPRFASGGVPAVAGAIQTDGGIFARKVNQIYATGAAAVLVSSSDDAGETRDTLTGERELMFFGTSTNTGLKFAWEGATVTEIHFGYKRKEISVIPLNHPDDEKTYQYPSVLATLDNGYAADAGLQNTRFGVAQYFATGKVAENLARLQGVRDSFQSLAKDSVSQYRLEERRQRGSALMILHCLASVADDKLEEVRKNNVPLGLFKSVESVDALKGAAPAKFRATYAAEFVVTDSASSEYTTKLAAHESFVCTLAGKLKP